MSTPEYQPDARKPDRRPFQYSLAELFVLTCIVSGGASLLKCFPKAWPLVLNVGIWIAAIYTVHRFSPLSSDRKVVAVGTALTGGPPHRSVLEALPHTALTLGC